MKQRDILKEFEQLAEKLSLTVKYVKLDSIGGLCRVYDKHYIYIDVRSSLNTKISILANSFKKLDMSNIYLPPALRMFLEKYDE